MPKLILAVLLTTMMPKTECGWQDWWEWGKSLFQSKLTTNNLIDKKFLTKVAAGIIAAGATTYFIKILYDKLQGPIATIQKRQKKLINSSKDEKEKLIKTIENFIAITKAKDIDELWVNNKSGLGKSLFVQKLLVESNAEVKFFTDPHGDAGPTIDFIKKLKHENWIDENSYKIKEKNGKKLYIVGLGDYIDRGQEGGEILKEFMNLYIQNPNQVILIRGNHENNSLIHMVLLQNQTSDFYIELNNIYKMNWIEKIQVTKIFNYLPEACVLIWKTKKEETKGILCTHGGFKRDHKLTKLLKDQTKSFESIENILKAYSSHFTWSDFGKKFNTSNQRGKVEVLTRKEVINYFNLEIKNLELLGVLRGHQQLAFESLKKGNAVDIFDSEEQWDEKSTEPLYLKDLTNPFVLTLNFFRYKKYPKESWPNGKAPILTLELNPDPEKCKFTQIFMTKKK